MPVNTRNYTSEEASLHPPEEQTYILVYGSAVIDSKYPLLSLENSENGLNKSGSTASEGHAEAPPPPADCLDHEYARPSSPPPASASASAAESGGSAARSRKRRGGRRKKKDANAATAEKTECQQECERCGMLFPSAQRLADHQRKAHPVCGVCGILFTGVLKLREHEIKTHRLLPYSCEYCQKSFSHKAHRNLHVKARHTGEKTCHCDICGKGYSCVSILKTHRLTHFDKTFICDVCGKSFFHACHLTRHKHVHREVRPYRCSTCGKGFTQAENLKSHRAVHTGDRQLCSICGKSYRCLKNHMISRHSHELPAEQLPAADSIVSCEVCGKKFPNPSQYKVHKRSHTGEKPFHCDICGKSYRLKETLRDHRYTHTGEKPYSCGLCSKSFNTSTSFMRHRSIHTGETPYGCQDCGKRFRLLSFLKAHQQTKAHRRQLSSAAEADCSL
ncbi:zinc finger protein 98-like [Centroberyx affinis]|uniref:zinc finger protein 98-like n=1 Tax=Centroberyx affinis TaxID=166261 RepID=UPI003A5BB816